MPKFKISVSKNQKKYSVILSAGTENEARKKVHAEGYSILGVEEFNKESIKGHKFFFEATDKNGNLKKGQVVAKDPFKVYVKLRDGLKYKIKYLYSQDNSNINEKEKLALIKHLEEQYSLFKNHSSKNESEKEKVDKKKKQKKNLDSFYLKKELNETYRLIDFVLIKLKNLLEKTDEKDLSVEKKEKLQTLFNSITKIKKTTNVSKLKEIGELGLRKIGEIELEILEKYKDGNSKRLLNETNALLKKIGSKEQFVEKDKDIKYIVQQFFEGIKLTLSGLKFNKKKTKAKIDKESTSYWKTELLIKKYQEKKKDNLKIIIKNFYRFIFPFGNFKEKRDEIIIRRKIISQNITILKAKKTGKLVSYTKVVKGYNGLIEYFVLLLKLVNNYLYVIVYLFSVLFIVYLFVTKLGIAHITLNMGGVFTLIYIIIGIKLIYITRGVISLGFNIALFTFLFILGLVNF